MEPIIERALIKAMVRVMSIETEIHDIHKKFYEPNHEVLILEGLRRDLEAWKLILKLIQNESKGNSK